ncbi:MAG: pyruvate ferredoxin oxidoreductase [Candidatus Moranbacteria bacterium]|nr:pyruvate ferredoxin oxidoreductase [Candidatus Moranbacteria bacterium]
MIHNTKKRVALTGGAAAAEALRQIDPDVMPVYPITPQTPIIETFAKFQAEALVGTEIIPVESEHSMMSACVGASAAGARTVTATSSQGLALMNEVLYIASGLRLPILMLVSARALSAPINIHCDHSDVMGARDAGWIQIFSENVQEAYDNTLIGMKLAEIMKLPVMVVMDGFITSHSVENLEILPDNIVKKFVGEYQPEKYLLNISDPVTFGPVALPNSYFEFKKGQEEAMQNVFGEYQKIAAEFKRISGRHYDLLESYRVATADYVIVAAGSTAGTIKVAADNLRSQGIKAGLVKIKLFRPFPYKEIARVIKNAKGIAVLDRALSPGTHPPIYQEVLNSMYQVSSINKNKSYFIHDTKYFIQSYVYGLGGREIFQKDIEEVFEDLADGDKAGEIRYIGNKN